MRASPGNLNVLPVTQVLGLAHAKGEGSAVNNIVLAVNQMNPADLFRLGKRDMASSISLSRRGMPSCRSDGGSSRGDDPEKGDRHREACQPAARTIEARDPIHLPALRCCCRRRATNGGIATSRSTSATASATRMPLLLLPWDAASVVGVPTRAAWPEVAAPGAPEVDAVAPPAPVELLAEALALAEPLALGEPPFDGGGLPCVGLPVGPTPVPATHGPAPTLSQAGGSGAILARKFPSGWPAQNVGL